MKVSLARRAFGIAGREVTFATRGFEPTSGIKRERLENVGRMFVYGYHAALDEKQPMLAVTLCEAPLAMQGFVFEGAAMALTIFDNILPTRRRLREWLKGPAEVHEYMTYVGAGWAFARLPWQRLRVEDACRALHPFLWPLAMDGYGFHEGYFRANDLDSVASRRGIYSDHGLGSYYQGLGRSLWFVCGADPWAIANRISQLSPARQQDLWSGLGLACGYAGGMSAEEIQILARLAGDHRNALGQGACFAAKARHRAGNPASHTDLVCNELCGLSSAEAAQLTDGMLAETRKLGGNYRDWVLLLQKHLAVTSPVPVRK